MSRLRFILPVIGILFCLCLTSTGITATRSLSLDEFIKRALDNNPQIDIARQQYLGNKGVLTQARSGYLPRLTAGADYGRINIKDLQPVDEDNVGLGLLSATQLIYDFGRTTGLIDTSSFNLEASAENLKQVVQDVIFRVKSSFYSVLEKQRLIIVAEQAVKNYEQQLYRAQRFYEAGVRTRIDVTNADVNLSNRKLELLQANADYKVAKTVLENVIGTTPNNGDYELITDEPALDKLASSKPEMPGSLDDLLTTAKGNRPGLQRFTYLVKAAESAIKRAEGDYWPSIDAVGDYNKYESDLSTLTDQWQIGVGLRWEFFSGFETEGKVAEANAQLREVSSALREFDLSVVQDVTDSYLRADENREGVDIADQSLGLASENLRLADGRYKAGIGDLLEFNDAQLLYTENQSSLVVTYYTYLTALARIERATGLIPELKNYQITPEEP
jgi:outer membrane protein